MHALAQVLLVMVALAGALAKVGQEGACGAKAKPRKSVLVPAVAMVVAVEPAPVSMILTNRFPVVSPVVA